VHLWAKHNPHVIGQTAAAAFRSVDAAQITCAVGWPRDGPVSVSFDEMPSHWGAKTAGECAVCKLAVPGPMRLFRCGHAVHTECSTEEACSVCYLTQFKSLRQ
jgi:hypothetical protein